MKYFKIVMHEFIFTLNVYYSNKFLINVLFVHKLVIDIWCNYMFDNDKLRRLCCKIKKI